MSSIKKLEFPLLSFVKACSIVGSYHRICQELILNSLDAGATCIEIKVDFKQIAIEVVDNGCGISLGLLNSLQNYQWNHTTKEIASLSKFGCKGEALAAIRSLCHLYINSKQKASNLAYTSLLDDTNTPIVETQCVDESNVDDSACALNRSGCTIRVFNIFHNVPVRRKHIKRLTEIQGIMQFIQHISLLFYNVRFNVVEVDEYGGCKGILHMPVVESVATRFVSLHGACSLSKMQEVSVEHHGFRLSGLITPPISECLHWNQEMQYCFVNQRYWDSHNSHIRSNDLNLNCVHAEDMHPLTKRRRKAASNPVPNSIHMSNLPLNGVSGRAANGMSHMCDFGPRNDILKFLLNRIFMQYMNQTLLECQAGPVDSKYKPKAAVGSSSFHKNGPSSKHFDISKEKTVLYPSFVLQISCDPSHYDMLLEPDKSIILFGNPGIIVQLGHLLFKTLCDQTNSGLGVEDLHDARNSAGNVEDAAGTLHDAVSGVRYMENITANQNNQQTSPFNAYSFVSKYSPIPSKSVENQPSELRNHDDAPVAVEMTRKIYESHIPLLSKNTFNRKNIQVDQGVELDAEMKGIRDQTKCGNLSSPSSQLIACTYFTSPKEKLLLYGNDNAKNGSFIRNRYNCSHVSSEEYCPGKGMNLEPEMASDMVTRDIRGNDLMQHYDAVLGEGEVGCWDNDEIEGNVTEGLGLDLNDVWDASEHKGMKGVYEAVSEWENDGMVVSPHVNSSSWGGNNYSPLRPVDSQELCDTDNADTYTHDKANLLNCKELSINGHASTILTNSTSELCTVSSTANICRRKWKNTSRYFSNPAVKEESDAAPVCEYSNVVNNMDRAIVEKRNDSLVDHGSERHTVTMRTDALNEVLEDWKKVSNVGVRSDMNSSLAMSSKLIHDPPNVFTGSLSREHLACSRVIGQFAKKYIVVLSTCRLQRNESEEAKGGSMPESDNRQLLLCIDQHAADERIHYDAYCNSLRKIRTQHADGTSAEMTAVHAESFTPPHSHRQMQTHQVDDISGFYEIVNIRENPYFTTISNAQKQTIDLYASNLTSWGFGYSILLKPSPSEYTLFMHEVPKLHSELLTLDDFLEYIQLLARSCYTPSFLLQPPCFDRILTSHSCRHSIMFGDTLTRNQCVDLVHKLSNPNYTNYPFQCAHGRPSVAPLMEIKS